MPDSQSNDFPTSAGILLGIGLGGFFDGIVFHQLLQWHHMLSGWYPLDSIDNIRLNTTWDGIFHSATYVSVLAALYLLWRRARSSELRWPPWRCVGVILLGWGLFNLVEGVIDHEILGLHRVNETVPDSQRIFWDMGFLLWGAALTVIGAVMARVGAEGANAQGRLPSR